MGGVTAKGFPYPSGTDRVADGDNAIQALASTIDAYLERYTEVWGACTTIDTGPGIGGSMWMNVCQPIASSGGVTQNANGITVPKKGWYEVRATTQMAFGLGGGTTQATLFIGDGVGFWAIGSVIESANPGAQHNVQCQSVVLLNAGQQVRWGMSCAGPVAAGLYGGSARSMLFARLLAIVA